MSYWVIVSEIVFAVFLSIFFLWEGWRSANQRRAIEMDRVMGNEKTYPPVKLSSKTIGDLPSFIVRTFEDWKQISESQWENKVAGLTIGLITCWVDLEIEKPSKYSPSLMMKWRIRRALRIADKMKIERQIT